MMAVWRYKVKCIYYLLLYSMDAGVLNYTFDLQRDFETFQTIRNWTQHDQIMLVVV